MYNNNNNETDYLYLVSDENPRSYAQIFLYEEDSVKFARSVCDNEPDSHPILTIFRNGKQIERHYFR